MGLAASQARFLQLTARRSNLEYQGQQINQRRLSLANESAGLYQRQLTLVVPVPPSSQDDQYITPAYDFVDPSDGISKNVRFYFNDDLDTIIGYDVEFNRYDPEGNSVLVTQSTADGNAPWTMTTTTVDPATGEISTAGAMALDQWYIGFDDDGAGTSGYTDFNTGRITHVVMACVSTAGTSADMTKSAVMTLTYSPRFDQAKYNDDMNKYEYAKATYDYEVERINTETARIQQQDKSLELKLKQLDTEHSAISTEMEAVQKVIQNNVTSSFKTFST